MSELFTLKVDNISYRTIPDDLEILFGKYGKIGDIYIPKDGWVGFINSCMPDRLFIWKKKLAKIVKD